MDCSPPGSSIHGIFQARVLEWVAISFSRRSSWPRDWTQVSHIACRLFYHLSHQGSSCWSTSGSNCCFLTCIQISQEAGKMIWYSHLLKNFPQFVMIHRVKGFGIINKAEIDGFLELSCFFNNPTDVGNLISGSSAFSKYKLNIWKFMVHILLKPSLENFEHYFASVCNCAVIWISFGIAFLWDWNVNWPFPVLWPQGGKGKLFFFYIPQF